MKKSIYAILAVLTVFAMVMTGCDNGGGSKGDDTFTVTFNSNGGAPVPSPITGLKSGDKIAEPTPPTKTDNTFIGWYRDVNFPPPRWNFKTDTVTGNITLYARWILVAGDATVRSIIINGLDLDDVNNASIGEYGETLADVGAGTFEPGVPLSSEGVTIIVTPNQSTATVKWVLKTTDPTAAEFEASTNPTTPVPFTEGQKLYIKVTLGSTTFYYKINIYFAITGTVYYGRPDIRGSNTVAVDPLWEANYEGPVFSITRNNTSEVSTPPYRFSHTVVPGENHTKGSAKVYWDDEGLYVYATILYNDFYADETAQAAGTVTPRVTHMRGTFESDSLEIMINPRYQELAGGAVDRAQQYRVGFSRGDTDVVNDTWTNSYGTFTIGGNFRANPDPYAANFTRYAFGQTLKYNAWITKDANNKETGYKVICRVPWFLIGYDSTSAVFDATTGKVKTVGTTQGPKIGLEFQINARITEDLARDATLTCNTVALQALTNVTNWAVVDLVEGTGKTRVTEAHAPSILTQPRINGKVPLENQTEISVDAAVGPKAPAGNVLSYQWYQADTATGAGTTVGTNAATYNPANPDSVIGKYFYVVVTNTDNTATGSKTSSVTSRRFQYAKGPLIPADIEILNPIIVGVGGAVETTTGNGVFTLDNGDKGISYQFPISTYPNLLTTHKRIQIYFEGATTDTGKNMKVIVRQGYNSVTTEVAVGEKYPNITASGNFIYPFTAFVAPLNDGLTFQMNTDSTVASPAASSFTIKITKIVFLGD